MIKSTEEILTNEDNCWSAQDTKLSYTFAFGRSSLELVISSDAVFAFLILRMNILTGPK